MRILKIQKRLYLYIVMVLFVAFPARGAGDPKSPLKVTLSQLLKRALKYNAELKVKDQDIKLAESKLSYVRAQKLPTIQTTSIIAPIYEDLGDALTHKEDWGHWGPIFFNKTSIIQPIYGFGRLKYYEKAAKGGIDAEKKQRKMKADEIVYKVKEYFYTSLMAQEMEDQLSETESKLSKVIRRIDALLKAESGEVKQEDAFKLKVIMQELKKNKELTKKGIKLSLAALAYQGGYEPGTELRTEERKLVKERFELKSLKHYEEMALKYRPEILALNSGIHAYKNLITAEKKAKWPVFFLGGLLDIADTQDSIRTRQDTPYAYDPYNHIQGGGGLGMRWNLDFWKVNAKLDEVKADYYKLINQKAMAKKGIPLEVKKAYLEYQEASNNIKHAKIQRGYAKKWFMQSVFAWTFGVGDAREVLESAIFKGLADNNYYDGILKHNLSIAALTKSTGREQLSHLSY